MSIPFQDSETAKNLLRAFAGESQARNRYDFAANLCQKQELQAMAFIFQATAKQEQAHAKVFWDHLQALNGQNLPIYGAYPIEGTNRILELLRAAQHNEHEEHGSVYPSFAAIATQEGFPEAAASFRQIAAIEQLHGERFGLLADQLESGALFVSQAKQAESDAFSLFSYIWCEYDQPRCTSGKSLMSSSSPSFTETTAICPGSTSLLVPYW